VSIQRATLCKLDERLYQWHREIRRRSAVKIVFLEGDIKAWVKEFEGAVMEGFDEKYWEQVK
jgi:hypothetical protein